MITDIIKQARELLENNCGEVTVMGQKVTIDHLKMLNFMQKNLAAILDEVEKLRDAVKFYADETPGIRVEKAVPNGASCFMVIDRGQIARKALEGE